jgi:hypothetical protein
MLASSTFVEAPEQLAAPVISTCTAAFFASWQDCTVAGFPIFDIVSKDFSQLVTGAWEIPGTRKDCVNIPPPALTMNKKSGLDGSRSNNSEISPLGGIDVGYWYPECSWPPLGGLIFKEIGVVINGDAGKLIYAVIFVAVIFLGMQQ